MNTLDDSNLILEVIPRTMRSIREEIRRIAGTQFTTPQYRLLARIARKPGTNTELSDWMGVSAPTMTNLVDKLVKRGFVERASDRNSRDRRQVEIRATRKGMSVSKAIRGSVQQIFADKISTLPPLKRGKLVKGLQVLRELFPEKENQ